MAWIKLDDQWMEHPKIIKAGRDARDMWLRVKQMITQPGYLRAVFS